MGTPDIAVPTLIKLAERYDIVSVVTIPDKPKGRGLKVVPSPVKTAAEELNIPVLQPVNLRDTTFIDRIKNLVPDIIVVFAFRFLPKEIYTLSKISSFNIHTSLLPDYRGAAPIN